MHSEEWTKSEKKVCSRAFNLALDRECEALIDEVRQKASKIAGREDVWRLHDFLTRRRKEIDDKYDYRYSVLFFVFARLIGDGRLTIADLEGLSEDKLAKIRFLAGIS